jgi:hypothetical protein
VTLLVESGHAQTSLYRYPEYPTKEQIEHGRTELHKIKPQAQFVDYKVLKVAE